MNARRLALFAALLAAGPAAAQEGARALTPEEEAAAAPPPQQMVVTKAPELLRFVEAPYPEAAKAEQKAAAVQLILTIGADGVVSEVVLAGEPVGDGFDEAAIEAAKQFEFSPAHINGEPAAIRVPFTYRFEFVPDPAQEPPAAPEVAQVVGRVREKGTGLPLAAVPVSVGDREVLTDASGRFTLEALPPGDGELVVTSPDHRRQRLALGLVAGEEITVDVFVERLRTSPYETIVRGDRAQTSLTRRTLQREELRTVPGTFGDPIRVVQNLPGIARAPYVLGVLLVRGSTPGDSAVMIDGHEVPLLFHFLGGPSVLPPEMLDRIDYYPGNFSVRFGRAIGGIIDVGTRQTTSRHWQGSAEIDLFDASLYLEGPILDDLSFSASVRRSYIDGVLRGAIDIFNVELAQVLPRYYDYQARLDYRINRRHTLTLLAFGSDDEVVIVGEPGSNLSYDVSAGIGFHRLKLDWQARLARDVDFSLSPVIGFDTTGFSIGDVDGTADVGEFGLRYDLRVAPTETLTLRAGFDALARRVSISGQSFLPESDFRRSPDTAPTAEAAAEVERELAQVGGAAYLEAEWTPLGGPVTVVPGVRTDHYDWAGRHQWAVDPRVTARWTVDDDKRWVLKGGVGRFTQPPTEFQLDPDFGNPDLEPEVAWHYGLGVEHQFDEALSLDVQLFYIDRSNLSDRVEDAPIDADGKRRFFQNRASGRAYGLELLLRHEVTRDVYGWIAYTLSRSEENDGPGTGYEPTLFDQTHNLVIVASWKFAPHWETGLRFRLTSGTLETPVLGSTLNADTGYYEPLEGAEDSVRGTTFNQLDLRVERTWVFSSWQFAAFLDLQNVYNALNPEGTRYDYRYQESAPLPGLTILPTLGVRGSF
ncbi:MAG: TonB-dependent receptor [Myxococcales bacterium]|nr:TonB-dependent receptor [Myxococcales bacterium]